MLDFTSALYLDFSHPQHQLPYWASLTTGKPAALKEPLLARQLGGEMARMQGLEAGLIGPSTLHLFWDLFGMLDPDKYVIFSDHLLYPVGQSGVDRAKANGMKVVLFRHLSSQHLQHSLVVHMPLGKKPLIVTDGWCPRCGKPAPLSKYLQLIRPFGGLLVIDDTQGMGLLGENPSPRMPYGFGGGGILKWRQIAGPDIITISSWAKAFGVPVAALCGSRKWIKYYKRKSNSRINSSPVSNAHLSAAQAAIDLNRRTGNIRRQLLLRKVLFFQQRMRRSPWQLKGGMFPMQTLVCQDQEMAIRYHKYLAKVGIKTALLAPHLEEEIAILFLLRANHRFSDLAEVSKVVLETSAIGGLKNLKI